MYLCMYLSISMLIEWWMGQGPTWHFSKNSLIVVCNLRLRAQCFGRLLGIIVKVVEFPSPTVTCCELWDLMHIPYTLLNIRLVVIFLKSWTSIGYSSNWTGSYVSRSRFSTFIISNLPPKVDKSYTSFFEVLWLFLRAQGLWVVDCE